MCGKSYPSCRYSAICPSVNAAPPRTSGLESLNDSTTFGRISGARRCKPSAHPSHTIPNTATAACRRLASPFAAPSARACEANCNTSGRTCRAGTFNARRSTNLAATVCTWSSSSLASSMSSSPARSSSLGSPTSGHSDLSSGCTSLARSSAFGLCLARNDTTSSALRRVTVSSCVAFAHSTQNATTSGTCPLNALGCDSMSSSNTSNASPAFSSSPAAIAFRAVAIICGTKPWMIFTSLGSPVVLVTRESTALSAATLTLSDASFRPFWNSPPRVAKCCVMTETIVSVSDAKMTKATSLCASSGDCVHCARNSGRAFHWPMGTVALATLDTTSAMDRRTRPTGSLTTPSSKMCLTCSCASRGSRGQWPRTLRFRTTAASWRTWGSGSPRACVRSAGTTFASRATLRNVASALPRTSLSAARSAVRIWGRSATVAPVAALYVCCARTTRPMVRCGCCGLRRALGTWVFASREGAHARERTGVDEKKCRRVLSAGSEICPKSVTDFHTNSNRNNTS